jgi:hypothetical protein
MTVQQHIESFKADDHRARLVAEMRTERLSQRPGPRDKTEGEGVCGLDAEAFAPLPRRFEEINMIITWTPDPIFTTEWVCTACGYRVHNSAEARAHAAGHSASEDAETK